MAASSRAAMQPHIFGANALHYRQGTAVATAETPPTWSPELALNTTYPYTLSEYMRDVQRWMAATKVTPERQGPLLALAIGGGGRTVADELPDELLAHGAVADLGDGLGQVHRTGPKLLLFALSRKFPENLEATMLRTGLEFFAFTPLQQETTQMVFLRFDTMLDRANRLADLAISYPFRSWMLLSLLRLPAKKWAEYLKDMGHKFPRDGDQYRTMQELIVREKTLEVQVGSLGAVSTPAHGGGSGAFVISEPSGLQMNEPLPLYLCLGNPSGDSAPVNSVYLGRDQEQTFPTLSELEVWDTGIPDSDSESSTEEQWARENQQDPWSQERLDAEESLGKDPGHLREVFWQVRKAVRRFRAARGKFGPRRAFRQRKFKKTFRRSGPSSLKTGRPQKGFYIGDHFVSLDHVPEHELEAFFSGKSNRANSSKTCYNCGRPGHMMSNCPEPAKCFNCGQPGHVKADCPKLQHKTRFMFAETADFNSMGDDGFSAHTVFMTKDPGTAESSELTSLQPEAVTGSASRRSFYKPKSEGASGPTDSSDACPPPPDPWEKKDPWTPTTQAVGTHTLQSPTAVGELEKASPPQVSPSDVAVDAQIQEWKTRVSVPKGEATEFPTKSATAKPSQFQLAEVSSAFGISFAPLRDGPVPFSELSSLQKRLDPLAISELPSLQNQTVRPSCGGANLKSEGVTQTVTATEWEKVESSEEESELSQQAHKERNRPNDVVSTQPQPQPQPQPQQQQPQLQQQPQPAPQPPYTTTQTTQLPQPLPKPSASEPSNGVANYWIGDTPINGGEWVYFRQIQCGQLLSADGEKCLVQLEDGLVVPLESHQIYLSYEEAAGSTHASWSADYEKVQPPEDDSPIRPVNLQFVASTLVDNSPKRRIQEFKPAEVMHPADLNSADSPEWDDLPEKSSSELPYERRSRDPRAVQKQTLQGSVEKSSFPWKPALREPETTGSVSTTWKDFVPTTITDNSLRHSSKAERDAEMNDVERLLGTKVTAVSPKKHSHSSSPGSSDSKGKSKGNRHYQSTWHIDMQDEDETCIVSTGTVEPDVLPPQFSNSTTKIPGKEGPIVDTGAVYNLSGGDAVARQEADANQYGASTEWAQLDKPKTVTGVGDTAKRCVKQARVPGVLANGRMVRYTTPVVDGHPSPLPGLYGLRSMAQDRTYFGTHNGLMIMIPPGTDKEIQWPRGTTFNQCEPAPSGHWIMTTSNWHLVPKFAAIAKQKSLGTSSQPS